MPEMWQRTADAHREIGGEGRAAVLGMFGVSQVPNHAKYLGIGRDMHWGCPNLAMLVGPAPCWRGTPALYSKVAGSAQGVYEHLAQLKTTNKN